MDWFKSEEIFVLSTHKVGSSIYRIFTHEFQNMDYKTKNKYGKIQFQTSIEKYSIIELTDNIVTINELGRKSNGTFGYRQYDRKTGKCLDDNVPPANKSRRSIKLF